MEQTINQILKKAITLHQEGNFEEAKQLYHSILKTQPSNLDANNNLGVLLIAINKADEAEVCFKKVIELKPDFVEAHHNLGNALDKLNRLDEAEVCFKKAIELKPDFVEAHHNLGNALDKLNRLDEAEVCYKKVIELKSDYAEAYNNLGMVLQKHSKLKEAEACFKKAIELKADYAEAYNNLGILLVKSTRQDEAERSYRKAIELKQDFPEALNNLGSYLKNLERFDEAAILLDKALKINPKLKMALLNRGQIFFVKDKFELALRDFDLCDNEESRAYALTSLYNLGRIDDIYDRIEKCAELDDQNLRVAAFSSFISNKEKKITAHKFCNNPIDFIKVSNFSFHLKKPDLFITETIEQLKNIDTVWEGKTTYNGFHSVVNNNILRNSSVKLDNLNSIIMNEIDSYYLKYKDEDCSFIKKWPSKKNLGGWYIILKKQGYQSAHIHPTGWLSGVIYLKVVPSLEKNEGAIEFSLNGENFYDEKSPKLIHQPKAGDIVLFPSSLHHRTIPFSTDTDRIIVSFDLNPNP